MRVGSALANIRENVYVTGILTRDYLIDLDPAHAQQYVDQFEQIQAKTEQSFAVLEASGQDEQQKVALKKLRKELNAYWDPTEIIMDWSPEEKRARRVEMIRQRVRRGHEIFSLAGQVEQLMTANFTREQQRVTTADKEFRSSVAWTTGIALLLGVGIAGFTLARMLALETQSQAAESALRLLSGELRTAQEQERKYLSRELHDQVGQMLTGLRMELASLARLHGDSESELSSRIARAKGTVEQTLRIVRNIAMLLRPSMLDDLGLTPALAWLVKEVSRSSGIKIQTDIDPSVDSVPDAQRTCLYRIVQEALTNASRHSGATGIEVSLKLSGASVVGAIVDNGRGFDPANVKTRGLGILGMEERVREMGGVIRISSAPGRGARVEIRLPSPERSEVPVDSNPDRGRSRDRSDRVEASA